MSFLSQHHLSWFPLYRRRAIRMHPRNNNPPYQHKRCFHHHHRGRHDRLFGSVVFFFVVFTSSSGWFLVVTFVHNQQPISLPIAPSKQRDDTTTTTTTIPISVSSLQLHLPKAVPIFIHTPNPRHACLRKIREEHERLLRPKMQQQVYSALFSGDNKINPSKRMNLLIDPAYHENVGDHMITVAEQIFLHKLEPSNSTTSSSSFSYNNNNNYYDEECGYVQAGQYAPPCEQILRDEEGPTNTKQHYDPNWIWHGGGNWGDLWRRVQIARLNSLETWIQQSQTSKERQQSPSSTKKSIFMTMPNSWYYRNLDLQNADVTRIRKLLLLLQNNHMESAAWKDRVIFTWREQTSYDIAQDQLGDVLTNLLVPDIAFQLGPFDSGLQQQQQRRPVVDLLLLLRHDHESIYAEYRNRQAFRTLLESIPGAEAMTFSIVDWNDRYDRFHDDYKFFSDTAIQLLSLGKLVICDRLHAAILAYLSDLSFIYLDQESGKIHKTLSVAFRSCNSSIVDDERMSRAHNMSDAVTQAVQRLQLVRERQSSTTKDRKQRRQQLRQKQQQIRQEQ